MKQLLLATIAIILISSCSQISLPVSTNYVNNSKYSSQEPNKFPIVLANPAYHPAVYYRDANGNLIREENNTYPSLSDTLSANYLIYYRINERCKKFPDYIVKEKIYGDSFSNDSHQRLSSTLDHK